MRKRLLKQLFLSLLLLAVAAPSLAESQRGKFVLVIDAGHGGKDPGACGKYAREKDINLNVALELGRLVKANCPEVKVLYTRSTDVFVSLQGRANFANRNKADLFISIHTNALPKGRIAYGTETYTLGMASTAANLAVAKRENGVITLEDNYRQVYEDFDPNSAESYIIFELMQDTYMKQSVDLASCIQKQYARQGRKDKGVHQAGFLVLRNTSMPSVLTELGFISTPAEERYLSSKKGVRELARSIFNGFNTYYSRQTGKQVAELPVETPPQAETLPVKNLPEPTPQPKPVAQEDTPQPETVQGKPVFKVQLFVNEAHLKSNDARFKGLQGVECYIDGGVYKYTYGNTTNYQEIKKIQKKVAKKFSGTFVVAFIDGKRTDLSTAINLSKK